MIVCLLLITGVRRIIDIESGHFVNADYRIDRISVERIPDPVTEPLVQRMVSQCSDRHNNYFKTLGYVTSPGQRVDTNLMPQGLALKRNPHEVPLQTTVGKVLVEAERELQVRSLGVLLICDCNASHTVSGVVFS